MSEVSAPVVEVTVLEDRARVVRRGAVVLPAGQSRLVVRGVAPVLVDKTLTAVTTAGRVLDVRCRRRLAPWNPLALSEGPKGPSRRADEADALRKQVDDSEAAVAALAAELAVTEQEIDATAQLRAVVLAELAGEASWGRLPGGAAAELARIDERERAATARVAGQRRTLERARRDHAALRARAAEAAADAGTETADVEIDVTTDAAADATVTVEYLVPGACWRPYHTATLRDGSVTFATDACVWQNTGEDWRDAHLSFSTERPSLGATPPRLYADEVRVQRKSEQIVVEARDQDVDTTGLGSTRATATAAEVPGVDDGGVAQTLRAPHPATVLTDGRPYRVALGAHDATAELALVAMPERAPCAFTRTRQGNGGRPLLAGPVDLIRDAGPVGRTSILYVAPEERFELGWGPESDVRIHRDERRRTDEAGVLSSWNATRVRIALRLSNLGDAARNVEVTERIPVSEIDKVEIQLSAPDAWTLEDEPAPLVTERTVDDDGLVRWSVELPARGRRAIALEYVIRAHTSVHGI
jgi:uncharacterized protein (TIGR02231 family)